MKRIILLDHPFDADDLAKSLRSTVQKVTIKPKGLWYACGSDWETWKGIAISLGHKPKYKYTLDLDDSRVLKLKTAESVRKFDEKFGVGDSLDPDDSTFIDWRKVAEKWSGVEFCPYAPQSIRKIYWYQTLDLASGCVWDPTAIRGMKLEGTIGNPSTKPSTKPSSRLDAKIARIARGK